MGNAYLDKIDEARRNGVAAGVDIGMQMACDVISWALHDPDVMGKDTFGANRLRKVMEAALEKRQLVAPAWGSGPEADYYQEQLDKILSAAYGEIDPFRERYPYCKQSNYWPKSYRKG